MRSGFHDPLPVLYRFGGLIMTIAHRLELMIVMEDRFADVVITDEEVDQLEVVGDLIRHIENADHERRRRSNVEATTMRNNTNRPRTWPQSCHWK